MGMKIPNPFVALQKQINLMLDRALPPEEQDQGNDDQAPTTVVTPVPSSPPTSDASVPVPVSNTETQPATPETTIVTGHFVPDTAQQQASQLYTSSQKQIERLRNKVEQFDEDRQEPIEWIIRRLASLFCYIAPFVIAVPVGLAVGDAFTMPHAPAPGEPVVVMPGSMSFAIHLMSIFLEVLMPCLGLATTIAIKRAAKDRTQVLGFIIVAAFFVVLSLANGFALLFLLEQGVPMTDPVAFVGVVARSFGTFIIDLGCTIYLSVSSVRSLRKYLADQRQKIVALRDANQTEIEMEQTQIQAAMHRQGSIMDMQSKQQRAQTWNEIERMQSQAMIDQARRSMQNNGGSSYQRRGF